ncbi:MAG: PP2C family protein-serine/threonine phosphatase [Acidimicrobiales bacterium]
MTEPLGAAGPATWTDGGLSPGEEVLGSLLTLSRRLHPDDVPAAVDEHARRLGATEALIHLVDLEQRVLLPLPRGSGPPGDPLDIDSTLAGRSFRAQEILEGEAEGGGRRLWLPLLDGAERLGVLAVAVPEIDELCARRLTWLASLVADLVMTKSAYGDSLVLARRRRSMRVAAELRWSMLPPLSFSSEHVEIAAVLEPAYEVAGDSFDYAVNGSVAHVAVYDAMGHGLEASRMANLAGAIHRHGRRHGATLEATYMAVDAGITAAFGEDHFVTGQLASLDLGTGRLAFVSGGHPRPLLLRGTAVVGALPATVSTPMGLGRPPTVNEAQLEPGDRVVFYTDGVVEARSPTGEEFGIERLGDLLQRAAAAQELPAEMMRRLTHSVMAHEAGQLHDDATLLLIGWRAAMAAQGSGR